MQNPTDFSQLVVLALYQGKVDYFVQPRTVWVRTDKGMSFQLPIKDDSRVVIKPGTVEIHFGTRTDYCNSLRAMHLVTREGGLVNLPVVEGTGVLVLIETEALDFFEETMGALRAMQAGTRDPGIMDPEMIEQELQYYQNLHDGLSHELYGR